MKLDYFFNYWRHILAATILLLCLTPESIGQYKFWRFELTEELTESTRIRQIEWQEDGVIFPNENNALVSYEYTTTGTNSAHVYDAKWNAGYEENGNIEMPVSLTMELDQAIDADAVVLHSLAATGRMPAAFAIYGSNNNADWDLVVQVAGLTFENYQGNSANIFLFADYLPSYYTLNTTAQNGVVNVDPEQEEYLEASSVQLEAVPDPGFIFDTWSGDVSGSENPMSITMDADKNITANFLDENAPQMSLSSSSLSFSGTAASQEVTISSNVEWSASATEDWISISPVSGTNDGQISISVTENNSGNNRNANVVVTGTDVSEEVVVFQRFENEDGWGSVGMGIDGIHYHSPYSPFTDVIKSLRWIDVASWNENGFPASAHGDVVKGRAGVGSGSSWPSGHYVLTWKGEGDVQVTRSNMELVSEDLSGEVKRRVYNINPDSYGIEIEINSFPVDEVSLFLPGLEDHPSVWNPVYIEYLRPFAGGPVRFMDLNGTNNSNQVNWDDRTPSTWSTFVNINNNSADHHIKGNAPYEVMIEICNEIGSDMWITIPHQATDEYVQNLAYLILTGIDKATGEKTTAPLDPSLKVWVEYSNEVWNWNFTQSNWVNDELATLGDNLDERYARKAVSLFDIFVDEFGGTDRLVRVLSTQIGWGGGMRTRQRIEAVPRDKFDAIALTTYFDPRTPQTRTLQYAYDNWPLTQDELMDWIEDKVGQGPFVPDENLNEVDNAYWSYYWADQHDVPVVSYEGNEHINPVRNIDTDGNGEPDTQFSNAVAGGVDFVHEMVRTPRFGGIYRKWLQRHHESGLVTNMPFVMLSGWSEYGQWGHVEYVGQKVDDAQKYKALLDFYNLLYPDLDNPFMSTEPVLASSITIVNTNIPDLTEGDAYLLSSSVSPSNASNKETDWSSRDETVVTIDASGLVTAVGEGTATITATSNDGGFTDQVDITVTDGVTFNGRSVNDLSLKVWPNPVTNGVLYISVNEAANYSVRVVDMNGRQVKAPRSFNNNKMEISTSGLPGGVYLVEISTNEGEKMVRYIVLQ